MHASPRHLALTTGLGLAASALVLLPTPSQAAGQALVINEVYGGSNATSPAYRNDFVELRNTSGAAVSLHGTSLQYRGPDATGVPSPSAVYPLPGVQVPAGGTYLVAGAAAKTGTAGQALPAPDATWGADIGTNGGQVFLADTTEPVDPNLPAGTSGSRLSSHVVDFVGWGAKATSFEGTPAAGTGGTKSLARNATGTDTDDNDANLLVGAPTPVECGCADETTPATLTIAEVQGSGATSPNLYDTVTTEGHVTAVYPNGGLDGFFLQNGDTAGSSDAVFVAGSKLGKDDYPALNDSVRVTGIVKEVGGETQITGVAAVAIEDLTTPVPAPAAAPLAWNSLGAAEREDHEGELVSPQGAYTVTDVSQLHSEGMIGLTPGNAALVQPTESDAPGAAAEQKVADNAARMIALDDGATTNYAPSKVNQPAQSKKTPWLEGNAAVRVGDNATAQQPMVLDQREGSWRLQPTARVNGQGTAFAAFTDSRPANANGPQAVGGDVGMATFDVGGYFTTLATGADCDYAIDDLGNHNAVIECPIATAPGGAATATSLKRQRDKLVTAINALDAGIVALQDVENSARFGATNRDAALNNLVGALNTAAGAGTWAAVPTPATVPAKEELVRTALIYRRAYVRPVGAAQIHSDEANFGNAVEPLAQAFTASNGLATDAFAVVVNQFSERNGIEYGVGPANTARTGQATSVAGFASTLDNDAVFLLGNFNAYTMEEPIQDLLGQGYQRVDTAGEATYSAHGASGSLDHVLGNVAAMAMVTGGDVWDINAAESEAYSYRRYNNNATRLVFEDSAFASSDHNPLLVGLNLSDAERAASTAAATAPTAAVLAGSGKARVTVNVTSTGMSPTGDVAAYLGSRKVGTAALSGGKASVVLAPFAHAGTQTVTMKYLGDGNVAASQKGVSVRVGKARSAMTAKATKTIIVKKTKAKLATVVKATGLVPTGKVTAKLKNKVVGSGALRAGKATLTLAKFTKTGSFKLAVSYGGSADVGKVSKTVTVKVRK